MNQGPTYISTRGETPRKTFSEVLLAGLAEDGGLFLPETWPRFSTSDLQSLAGAPYGDVAEAVVGKYTDAAFSGEKLRQLIDKAYATFNHDLIAPLSQIGPSDWLLELFHGPTLAFKDVAMQLLGVAFEEALKASGERMTIVGATSGDTGAAAIEAVKGRLGTEIFILFPDGRVSPFQQRQMTTVDAPNTHALAVKGTFDDCQRILKDLFADTAFRNDVRLSGVNSINWARIVPQIVYYVTSALALGAPGRPVSFVVPTGNFGDIFAGYVAKKMGVPINRLIIATNENDILARCLATGEYKVQGVTPTTSPSMDIQVSSNFERLLFEVSGRDDALVRGLMASLSQSGGFDIPATSLSEIQRDFSAFSADENEVKQAIADCVAKTSRLIDPHTAVGAVALEKARAAGEVERGEPVVLLSTAHPAKFSAAVKDAAGIEPSLPPAIADFQGRAERFDRIEADTDAIKNFIRSRLNR